MSRSPTPAEIFARAAEEGARRLNQSTLELLSTGFIAGFTIVFGIIAFGVVDALARPSLGDLARLPGALAFGLALPFLILGRAELFSENYLDPIAAVLTTRIAAPIRKLIRLWALTLILNLVGGAVLVLLLTVDGALPAGARQSLSLIAAEIADRDAPATLVRAILGGALVALLSYLVVACGRCASRLMIAYAIGALLALGPFEHAVVTALHLGFGWAFMGPALFSDAVQAFAITIAGNALGGGGLVTLSHAARARGGFRAG